MLADIVHLELAVFEEGPGEWREQRQAGFSWSEMRIHNPHGQQLWIELAHSAACRSKAAEAAPAACSSSSQYGLLEQAFQPGTQDTNFSSSFHRLLTKPLLFSRRGANEPRSPPAAPAANTPPGLLPLPIPQKQQAWWWFSGG